MRDVLGVLNNTDGLGAARIVRHILKDGPSSMDKFIMTFRKEADLVDQSRTDQKPKNIEYLRVKHRKRFMDSKIILQCVNGS